MIDIGWPELGALATLAAFVYGVVHPFLPRRKTEFSDSEWTKLHDLLTSQTASITSLTQHVTELSSEVKQLRSVVVEHDKEHALVKQRVDQLERERRASKT